MVVKHKIKVKKKLKILKLVDHVEKGEVLGVELSKDGIIPDFNYCWIKDGNQYLIHEKSNDELYSRIVGLEDNEKDASAALYEFATRRAKRQKVDRLDYTRDGETISRTPEGLLIYILKKRCA